MNTDFNRTRFLDRPHMRAIVVWLTLLLLIGGGASWWFRQEPLSATEKSVLRTRVDRFATHFSPEMSGPERTEIVNGAHLARKLSVLSRIEAHSWLLVVSLVATVILLWRWWLLGRRARRMGIILPRYRVTKALSIVVLVVGVGVMLSIWKLTRPAEAVMENAGGWVDEGEIVLSKGNKSLIHNTDQLIGVFDHELTHLFGQAKYRKIRRDSWLSYAYAAVLALERGGFPTLQKEEAIHGEGSKYHLYWYAVGMIFAGGTLPPDDPESEFIKGVELTAPTNPDAVSDSPDVPGALANKVLDYGMAGIAWYLSAGNGDIALSYLDDRSNGIPPLKARERTLERVRLLDNNYDGRTQIRQSEIFNEALRYRLKLGREEQEKK